MIKKNFRLYSSLMIALVLFGAILPAPGRPGIPQDAQSSLPLKFSDYDFGQFISSTGYAPQNIIQMDNNAEIVLACLDGKTRNQLKAARISFTESQLVLLVTWKVLEENKSVLKTTFPVMNADQTLRLRDKAKIAARSLAAALRADVVDLVGQLNAQGRRQNAYTILFSYLLDHIVWDLFRENRILEPRSLTVDNPFWDGELWASFPKREFFCGTNTIADKGVALNVNWTEKAIRKMVPFVADWKNFGRMFEDYAAKGFVENEEAKTVFAPFRLFDGQGRFTVPIIDAAENNALYQVSLRIARRVADDAPVLLKIEDLAKEFGFRDAKQALVIGYHELMWALLDELESQELIRKPVAFSNPEKAEAKDIADLVFIVRDK